MSIRRNMEEAWLPISKERERERTEVLQGIEEAWEMVTALCKPKSEPGSRDWVMRVPARRSDPDLVIGRALARARRFVSSA